METLTSEQETYNKLYTRILCLIVEQFHFELQDMEDFAEVVDLRMELVAQDSLSAKALKQLNFLRKEQERKKMARPSDPEKKEMEEFVQRVERERRSQRGLASRSSFRGSNWGLDAS